MRHLLAAVVLALCAVLPISARAQNPSLLEAEVSNSDKAYIANQIRNLIIRSNGRLAVEAAMATVCVTCVPSASIAPSSNAAAGIAPDASSAAQSCRVLKASGGNLFTISATITTVSGYIMLFDATSAPGDGAVTPVWWYPVISDGTRGAVSASWEYPEVFATGITACFSSTGPFIKTASTTAAFSSQFK